MTTTQSPAAPAAKARSYADYSAPLWRRWLLTREMAVIALTVAVFVYATINVDNFDEIIEQLRSKGVTFEDVDFGELGSTVDGVISAPDGTKAAWFKDSEGNILSVSTM